MKRSLYLCCCALLVGGLFVTGCTVRAPSVQGPAVVSAPQAIPKVDVHAHYWKVYENLIPKLDAWSMRAVLVNVASSGNLEEKWQGMLALQAAHPDHFVLCTTFDPFLFNEPDFAERVVRQLEADVAQGARMVKVWKNIGLELKDTEGRYVHIDHERFQPIWDFLADAGIPVLAHIAEPRAAWLPLDERSPHYHYYRTHPEYHAYNHPEMPRWETIIEARDRWVARNPDLVIVGAHLGSMAHDVDEVARRLEAYPNFHVETAARFGDLAAQPSERVRAFMIRYQDRILYGTDVSNNTVEGDRLDEMFGQHGSYLTRADSVYVGNIRTQGLDLPREALEKIYARNAERLLDL